MAIQNKKKVKNITYKDLQGLNNEELDSLKYMLDRETEDRKEIKDLGGMQEVIYANDGCEGIYFKISEIEKLDNYVNAREFIRYVLQVVLTDGGDISFSKTEIPVDDDQYIWEYDSKEINNIMELIENLMADVDPKKKSWKRAHKILNINN